MYYKNLNLENFYHYLILGKFLQIDLKLVPIRDEIYEFIRKCEMKSGEFMGFKFFPESSQKGPDVLSTSYALVILRILGRLDEYSVRSDGVNIKSKIKEFLLSCRTKKKFLHCKNSCQICKKTSEYKTFYSVLESILALEGSLYQYEKEFLPLLSNSSRISSKNLFRLLDLKFFSSYDDIKDEELDYFRGFQRKDGGFNLSNKSSQNSSKISETFWVSLMLENYRFLKEYPRGKTFAFLIQNLKKVGVNDAKNPIRMMEYSKQLVLLAYVWGNLIDDLEDLIFGSLTQSPIMNINDLIIRGGVKNAEYEIVAFINLKYNLVLNITDNSTRFNQFHSRLDSIERYFAKKIYDRAKKYVRIDLNEILVKYNRNLKKSHRVQIDLLLKLIQRFIDEFFIKGKIVKKNRMFKKYYYLDREEFIPKVITCDRIVNFDDIIKEKKRLESFKEDIFNMAQESKKAANNIMAEVESLIFVGEVDYARKRLKNNIKKALMDAEFFNKNTQQILEDFEYIKGKDALKGVLTEWVSIYNRLNSDFNNVNQIMLQKLEESEKDQQQKEFLTDMESQINRNITELGLGLEMFKEAMRTIDKHYSREKVDHLQAEFGSLYSKIGEYDRIVVKISKNITNNNELIKKKRKKLINNWISNKEDFQKIFNFYKEGFSQRTLKLKEIDEFLIHYSSEIDGLKQKVNIFIADKEFAKFSEAEKEFGKIVKSIDVQSENFFKTVNSLLKKRKLYLLFINLEKEWEDNRQQLEVIVKDIRKNLKVQVEIDQNRKLKEDYIIKINESISFLKDLSLNLEKQIISMLDEGEIPNNEIIEKQFSYLEEKHEESRRSIENSLKTCEQSIPDFKNQADEFSNITSKWLNFQKSFKITNEEVKSRIINKIIRKTLIKETDKANSNKIDISIIAKDLQINKKIVFERIEHMLNISRISGDFISGTSYIILHNNDWRHNKRLKLFIDREVREIKSSSHRIKQLYDSTISRSSFLKNLEQLKDLAQKFYISKENSDIAIEQKINELKPNKNNELFIENIENFHNEVKTLTDLVDLILLKIEKSEYLSLFIEENLKSIDSLINFEIHRLEKQSDEKKLTNFNKNKIWIQQEFLKIDNEISDIQSKIKNSFIDIWKDVVESEQVQNEIESAFNLKINEILNQYKGNKDDIDEKLANFEYIRVKKETKKFLQDKQDLLNNHLGKIQYDVKNRIDIKDFKSAMQKLHSKLSSIKILIKQSEKEFKQYTKSTLTGSKLFSVKNYLLEQWEIFIDEFRATVKEKQLNLELEIIEFYIKLVIKAFKDDYIPFNYLSSDLNLKKSAIKERIITLIGEKRLPGKIYLELEIYYENEEILKTIDKTSIELIKSSNVNTYIFINRLRRLSLKFYPILMIIGAVLTIMLSLGRILAENIIEGWVIIVVVSVILALFSLFAWLQKKSNFDQPFKE